MRIDDLERQLRKKIDDCKRLEQQVMSSETENEIVKREIVQITAVREELKAKLAEVSISNSSCYNRMMEYSEKNEILNKNMQIKDNKITQMTEDLANFYEQNSTMSIKIYDLSEHVKNLETRLNSWCEKLTTSEEECNKLKQKLDKKAKILAKTTKKNDAMEVEY